MAVNPFDYCPACQGQSLPCDSGRLPFYSLLVGSPATTTEVAPKAAVEACDNRDGKEAHVLAHDWPARIRRPKARRLSATEQERLLGEMTKEIARSPILSGFDIHAFSWPGPP